MNIKELREKKQLTQTDVAKLVGVSLTSYRMWELEVTTPTEDNMKRLKEVLEVGRVD